MLPNQPMPQPMPQQAGPQINPQQAAMLQQALAARQGQGQPMPQGQPQMPPQPQVPPQGAMQPRMAPQAPQPAPINPQQQKLAAALQNAKVAKDGNGAVTVTTGLPGDMAQSKTSASGHKTSTKEVQAGNGAALVTKTTKEVKPLGK